MMRTLLLCIALPLYAQAQGPGKFDILLFSLRKTADSTWRPDAPQYLNAFNKGGYNNQPNFFNNNELWMTAQFVGDNTTDIISLDLTAKSMTRVTDTKTLAEYSPTSMPGGKRFSVVRVEEDGNQRLWSFPIDRSDNGRVELPKIYNVGYHCWLRDTLVALFIVGDDGQPHTLYACGVRGQQPVRISSNIGRCLQKRTDGRLLFVHKPTEQTWFLKSYDPVSKQQEIIVKMPAGTEDYALLSDGSLLCGSGSKLFQYNARRDTDWREIADLSKYGVKKASRMAVSKDGKLAVVVE